MRRAPETFHSERLTFRRPRAVDAPVMFARYSSDAEVTKFLAWPRHESVDQTNLFIIFSDQTWANAGFGPWLVWSRDGSTLLGSTGLEPGANESATTGYLLVKEAWGQGLATEVLRAMMSQARALGLKRLGAIVHPSNAASIHVLEKAGLTRVDDGAPTALFPNLDPAGPLPIFNYAIALS